MRIKKIAALCMAVLLIFSLCLSAYADPLWGFEKTNIYDDSVYYDVDYGDWYCYYVGSAYEYGIMGGVSPHYFSPNGSITLAEVITVAARLNAAHYGNVIDTQVGSSVYDMAWFLPYMIYAAENGIISATEFSSRYQENATRAEIAYILYKALPDCYTKINDISPIPDVDSGNIYYYQILTMYESGVLTGGDEYGTFYPNAFVKRCEVAAMVSRIVDTSLRVYFSLNQNKPYKTCSYVWQYPAFWNYYSIDIDISHYDYNYFASIPRSRDYSVYAKDKADESMIYSLAETLKSYAINSGYTSEYDIVGFIAAFVQSLEYQDDFLYKCFREYPKYPIETLFDMGGDCEDTAVLLAKMLKLLGYGAVLLESTDHMAVGVQTDGNGNLSYEGKQYYYIETTDPGWRVGDVPSDMVGVNMQVVYI